jgi:hypothetical protein
MTTITYVFNASASVPEDIKDFAASMGDKTTLLTWTPATDIDMSHYVIRHSPSLTGGWASAQVLVDKVARTSTAVAVPTLSGTYFIKGIDLKGYESTNASLVYMDTSLIGVNVLLKTDEVTPANSVPTSVSASFSGTKQHVNTRPGLLMLESNTVETFGSISIGNSVITNPTGFYDTTATPSMPLATCLGNTHKIRTNYVPDASNMMGWSPYVNAIPVAFTTSFSTVGYRFTNNTSWNGISKTITLPAAGTYTFSAWYNYISSTTANNGATLYISGWGGADTTVVLDKNIVGWQRLSKTLTTTTTTVLLYLISYGGSQIAPLDTSSWEVTMPQVEYGPYVSDFFVGQDNQGIIKINTNAWNTSMVSSGIYTGKWYWEYTINKGNALPSYTAPVIIGGLVTKAGRLAGENSYLGGIGAQGVGIYSLDGRIWGNNSSYNYRDLSYIPTPIVGQNAVLSGSQPAHMEGSTVGVFADLDNGILEYSINGVMQGPSSWADSLGVTQFSPAGSYIKTLLTSGTFLYPAISTYGDAVVKFAFNKAELKYPGTIPTGYNLIETGVANYGVYTFPNIMNIGKITQSRVTSELRFEATSLLNTMNTWSSLISQSNLTGTNATDALAYMEIRGSKDNITWSTWERLYAGDYSYQYYQFRCILHSMEPVDTPAVQALAVTVDMPDIIYNAAGVVSGVVAKNITFTNSLGVAVPFMVVPSIAIQAQGMVAGDYYTITNKTISGFTINFYSVSNAAISRTFDWMAKGY